MRIKKTENLTELVDRIQDWYKLNCNGDWEHSYGYSIATIDNPGWTIRIDLSETPLENLEFNEEYQNKEKEHDWFFIKNKEKVLNITCGPNNLKQVFNVFFDTIIPKFADKDFYYELYVPVKGHHFEIWTPVKARIVNEKTVEIIEISQIDYKKVKVNNIDEIDFNQTDLDEMKIDFQKGDIVEIDLEEVFDGILLIPKK